ncbi:hypothetical protein BH10PSE11_BH10PSE11_06270 [soil metagenome]
MTKTREYLAQRARVRRAIGQKLVQQQAAVRRAHISEVLCQIKAIIRDEEFVALLATQRIKTAPDCLYRQTILTSDEMTDAQIANCVLVFIVAWKFLFPVLGSQQISDYLERKWPGFIGDLKDTFITLIMDGPFPHERRNPVRPTYFS